MQEEFDVFVIGGGINGCGIARDAAGRGYSVCLVEMNDLASGTSSWSSKLIHGGLRYLEHYEFRLVREALGERETLLKSAPHIIWPMRFILPHHKGLRPAWFLRLGLFLYDHIGSRKLLDAAKAIDFTKSVFGQPLKKTFSKGFEYSDCWVDDARLVVLNAKDAAKNGTAVHTNTKCIGARRDGDHWLVTIQKAGSTDSQQIRAKLLVNAAGPWVDQVLGGTIGKANTQNVRLVQGSHIVVPKLYDHDRAYIFQNSDGRVVFALPYEQDFTLIGTTDQDYAGDPAEVEITAPEIAYLCDAASEYFEKPVSKNMIVWSYSGVRPLFDDGASEAQEATRDYVLKEDGEDGAPRLVNIFGGKITTYRRLAESVLDIVEDSLGVRKPAWTAHTHLSGGDFPVAGFDDLVSQVCAQYAFLDQALAQRLVRAYGTCVWDLLGDVQQSGDMGQYFGDSLSAREVTFLIEHEWARTADDVLWRRSKLGLRLTNDEALALKAWMERQFT